MKMSQFSASMGQVIAKYFATAALQVKRIQAHQFRTATPPRRHRGKDRADGPGVGATVRMLMRSNRKGYIPYIQTDLKAHGWYRRAQHLAVADLTA